MKSDYLLVTTYLLLCLGYFLFEYLAAEKSSNKIIGHTKTRPSFYIVLRLNVAGILLFGGFAFFCSKTLGASYLFPVQMPTPTVWLSILILSTMAFILSYRAAQQKVQYSRYCANQPIQTELSLLAIPLNITLPRYVSYLLIRLVYLFSYEYFYRGVFLFNTSEVTGWFWAIAINAIVYLLSHSFTSKAEIIGTIPFGVALCYVSYEAHSFLPAFIIHLVLGFTYENVVFISYFFHPKKHTS